MDKKTADMPLEIKERVDEIMAFALDDKADNNSDAKATILDIMERMKRGSDE